MPRPGDVAHPDRCPQRASAASSDPESAPVSANRPCRASSFSRAHLALAPSLFSATWRTLCAFHFPARRGAHAHARKDSTLGSETPPGAIRTCYTFQALVSLHATCARGSADTDRARNKSRSSIRREAHDGRVDQRRRSAFTAATQQEDTHH